MSIFRSCLSDSKVSITVAVNHSHWQKLILEQLQCEVAEEIVATVTASAAALFR
jgi:hypothetical protein